MSRFSLPPVSRRFSVMLQLAALILIHGAQLQARAGIEEEILGKWSYKGKQAGATIESTAEFKEKGVYACSMMVSIFGTKSTITFKGKWRVEKEANVIIEVTETSSPLFIPKGKVMRKDAVKIQDDVMEYQYAGKPEREVRITDSAEGEKKLDPSDRPSSPKS